MSYKFDTLFCVKYLRSRSTINFPSEADNEDYNLYRVAQKKKDNTLYFRIIQKLLKLWFLYLVPIMAEIFNTFAENFGFVGKKTKERHCF